MTAGLRCIAQINCVDVGVIVLMSGSMQDMTLRPSLKDIDEELVHMIAEQSAVNDTLADKRQKDQALLEQMLPPQVTKPPI